MKKQLPQLDHDFNVGGLALSKPEIVVETSDAYSFVAAAKALEKGAIAFQTEKEYTADLVEGRSFLGPYVWRIFVEEKQRQEACRLIEEGGGCAVIDAPDEEDTTADDEEDNSERRFWILLVYGSLTLMSVVLILKQLVDLLFDR